MLGAPRHRIDPALVARRRAFEASMSARGYHTLADVGFDGPWVSPIQMLSGHPTGPVLLAKDFLDASSLRRLRAKIAPHGYLPGNPFNRVIDLALTQVGLRRDQIYITQCFAAIQDKGRSSNIPVGDYRASFEHVVRHELTDRNVLALGPVAQRFCAEFQIPAIFVPNHPSARGPGMTDKAKASALATALRQAAL